MSQPLTLDVYCPAIGQEGLLNKTLGLLYKNSTHATLDMGFYVIDNASAQPLCAMGATLIRNEENLGMVGSLRQAVEHSEADVLVYLHSDFFLYEPGWDTKLVRAFKADPKLAVLGVVGASRADENGGRSGTVCAFRNAHEHGSRPTQHITPVALLDGCFGAYRRAALENLDWEEFEENGYYFYDKDISLTLTMQSWHVGVINFDCEHLGGQTSCRPEFSNTLSERGESHDIIYDRSEKRYLAKWGHVLPVTVRHDWHVDVGVKR